MIAPCWEWANKLHPGNFSHDRDACTGHQNILLSDWSINGTNENSFLCLCCRIDAVHTLSFLIIQTDGLSCRALQPLVYLSIKVSTERRQAHWGIALTLLCQWTKTIGNSPSTSAQNNRGDQHEVWDAVMLEWMPRACGGHCAAQPDPIQCSACTEDTYGQGRDTKAAVTPTTESKDHVTPGSRRSRSCGRSILSHCAH